MILKGKIEGSAEDLRGLVKDSIVLNWHQRRKSRQRLRTTRGVEVCIVLPRGTVLREGDILYRDTHSYIVVEAEKEDLVVVFPKDLRQAAFVAYEFGNRHLPMCILKDRIKTPYNKQVEDFLKRYSLRYELRREPFEPLRSGSHHG